MRALVISDTHFGAWTGQDILREPANLALLEPHLDVDEVIFLGDMFDLLFGSQRDAFEAAEGLLALLRSRLQGKRFVFLAGNHDHHVVSSSTERLLDLELATGRPQSELDGELRRSDLFRAFLERHLEGVEVDIRYPTYSFAGVLCSHGHYLDFHARRAGATGGKLLARALWTIAVGGQEHTPTVEDYEATITMLTSLLYTIAQLPNGTNAQQRAFAAFQAIARGVHASAAPVRALEQAGAWVGRQLTLATRASRQGVGGVAAGPVGASGTPRTRWTEAEMATYEGARSEEVRRRRQTGAPAGAEVPNMTMARLIRPSDPLGPAVTAFDKVVHNLGWATDTDKIVFAHTHQPIAAATVAGSSVRYWNTGSWIYEPDLSSRETYLAYLRNAWPGTAVLIDSDEPEPRLLRLREHLNPLHAMSRSA
jgi:UDP-2,3-diacylglucosamine pyrophosphatase LpxH